MPIWIPGINFKDYVTLLILTEIFLHRNSLLLRLNARSDLRLLHFSKSRFSNKELLIKFFSNSFSNQQVLADGSKCPYGYTVSLDCKSS